MSARLELKYIQAAERVLVNFIEYCRDKAHSIKESHEENYAYAVLRRCAAIAEDELAWLKKEAQR